MRMMRMLIPAAWGLLILCTAQQAPAEVLVSYGGEDKSDVGKPLPGTVDENVTAENLEGFNLSPFTINRTSGGEWIAVNQQSDTVKSGKIYPKYLYFKIKAAPGTTIDATSLTLDARAVFADGAKDASFGVDSSADADGYFDKKEYSNTGGSYTNALLTPDDGSTSGVIDLSSASDHFEFPLGSGYRNLNEVSFRIYPAINNASTDQVRFDNITLKSEPIPEPRSAALAGVGCGLVLMSRRWSVNGRQ